MKVYFISLGCPRNLVDTEVMLGILLKAGYEATTLIEEADYVIINTCGFLQTSRDEALDTIDEVLHNRQTGTKVIVTGCMVQHHSKEILETFPDIDYLIGSGDVEHILAAVEATQPGAQISDTRSYLEKGDIPRQVSTPSHFAYLKVAEGCRKRCSYCIIPHIKGPLKSKSISQIKKEFRTLREQGAKEIILIAQDLGDWGKDLPKFKKEGLVQLLKELLKEPGGYWLRLMYVYPDEITDDLITLMKSDSRICPYLDMPIQHINNTILTAMHRRTSREQIISIITKLRKEIPQITLRTSLIVGFPGETDQQFQELMTFLKEVQLDNVGVFEYSCEPGSAAAKLPHQISEKVKKQRYRRLMKLQQKIVAKNNAKLLGQELVAIVEGYHPDSPLLMQARYRGQCPDIDGTIIINDTRNVTAFGQRYLVNITGVAGYDLVGTALANVNDSHA